MKLETRNLTKGPILKSLMQFSLPFMVVNIIQALYGAADTLVVGWFSDSVALSAVSVGSVVMLFITNFLVGTATGGTVVIGCYFGAEKKKETADTVGAMLLLFFVTSITLTGLMLGFGNSLMRLMNTPPEAYKMGCAYVRVCALGIPFSTGFHIVSAILRAHGNAKVPVIFISVSCVFNLALDFLFVGVLRMGPVGAAASTTAAQGLSLLLSVLYLIKVKFFEEYPLSFRFHLGRFREIVQIGLPISLQESLIHASFMFITAVINGLGLAASAAAGISNKFEAVAMLPAIAFSAALAAFVAQNMGAEKPQRAVKGVQIGIACSLGFGLVFFGISQIYPQIIFRAFNAEESVIAAGIPFLRAYSIDYLMVAFAFCLNNFFNGCGKSHFTMLNGILVTLLVRVPFAYLASVLFPQSLFGIGLAFPVGSLVSIAASLLYYKTGRWKPRHTGSAGPEENNGQPKPNLEESMQSIPTE